VANVINLFGEAGKERVCLSGFWRFKTDPEERGEDDHWYTSSVEDWDILYVPGNWNEQVPGYTWYMGTAWYARPFRVPNGWLGKAIWICFDAVIYGAKVWVNQVPLGEHEGGFTPFRLRAEGVVKTDKLNWVVVKVDNTLSLETIPPGEGMRTRKETKFDFFHYGGIHRAVYLEAAPRTYIADQTVRTRLEKDKGIITVSAVLANDRDEPVEASLSEELCDRSRAVVAAGRKNVTLEGHSEQSVQISLEVEKPRLWCFEDPYLYVLRSGLEATQELDVAEEIRVGIRSIEVKGHRILLNGRPVLFKGASHHEEFPVLGRAINGAVIRRDYAAMQTIGANSLRTVHYPYSKDYINMADELGILVTLEIPARGLDSEIMENPKVLPKVKQELEEAISTYKNHPSVWMWSLGNGPKCKDREGAKSFFGDLYRYAKDLDPTRPVTVENPRENGREEVFKIADVLTLHLYHGWKDHFGDIDGGLQETERILDKLHERYPEKPIIITEFGAAAIPGFHADPPEMWTEEYQAEFHRKYIKMILEKSKSYLSGGQIWALCDIRTPQCLHRMMLNRKGIFTRTREPKAAAKVVQQLYASVGNYIQES